jgi:hypothetical protein
MGRGRSVQLAVATACGGERDDQADYLWLIKVYRAAA